MSELPDRVERAFRRNEAFDPVEAGSYEVTTTPFDASVTVEAGDPPAFAVDVRAPTLSAATEDEVAEVVEEGWLETFERRMEDAHMPLSGTDDLDPDVAVAGEEVVVTATVEDVDPRRGAKDVRALVDYVEGTYLEGVIPGYDYDEPVASMRQRAYQEYDE
ncbi:hypothetical protein BRC81_15140 [Halobacteriales archaeon QS_1_68_20]|nr:MAG: hypothetical protein BRC81_15140 [Halobacteriales archaeon QS_1_68_20]